MPMRPQGNASFQIQICVSCTASSIDFDPGSVVRLCDYGSARCTQAVNQNWRSECYSRPIVLQTHWRRLWCRLICRIQLRQILNVINIYAAIELETLITIIVDVCGNTSRPFGVAVIVTVVGLAVTAIVTVDFTLSNEATYSRIAFIYRVAFVSCSLLLSHRCLSNKIAIFE